MSASVDRERAYLTQDIRMSEDRLFRVELSMQSAEQDFVRAVETVGTARVEAAEVRVRLTAFEASLCPACGCLKGDHDVPFDDDPRHGNAEWVCYDCGRDEECPR